MLFQKFFKQSPNGQNLKEVHAFGYRDFYIDTAKKIKNDNGNMAKANSAWLFRKYLEELEDRKKTPFHDALCEVMEPYGKQGSIKKLLTIPFTDEELNKRNLIVTRDAGTSVQAPTGSSVRASVPSAAVNVPDDAEPNQAPLFPRAEYHVSKWRSSWSALKAGGLTGLLVPLAPLATTMLMSGVSKAAVTAGICAVGTSGLAVPIIAGASAGAIVGSFKSIRTNWSSIKADMALAENKQDKRKAFFQGCKNSLSFKQVFMNAAVGGVSAGVMAWAVDWGADKLCDFFTQEADTNTVLNNKIDALQKEIDKLNGEKPNIDVAIEVPAPNVDTAAALEPKKVITTIISVEEVDTKESAWWNHDVLLPSELESTHVPAEDVPQEVEPLSDTVSEGEVKVGDANGREDLKEQLALRAAPSTSIDTAPPLPAEVQADAVDAGAVEFLKEQLALRAAPTPIIDAATSVPADIGVAVETIDDPDLPLLNPNPEGGKVRALNVGEKITRVPVESDDVALVDKSGDSEIAKVVIPKIDEAMPANIDANPKADAVIIDVPEALEMKTVRAGDFGHLTAIAKSVLPEGASEQVILGKIEEIVAANVEQHPSLLKNADLIKAEWNIVVPLESATIEPASCDYPMNKSAVTKCTMPLPKVA